MSTPDWRLCVKCGRRGEFRTMDNPHVSLCGQCIPVSLLAACRVVTAAGFTPVNSEANRRLRAWLDETNGWPPKDWMQGEDPAWEADQIARHYGWVVGVPACSVGTAGRCADHGWRPVPPHDAMKEAGSAELRRVVGLVEEQAEDEGLWFIAQTGPEAYLQQELRRLHTAIEAARSGHEQEL